MIRNIQSQFALRQAIVRAANSRSCVLIVLALQSLMSPSVFARQASSAGSVEEEIENIFVVGERRAYQGLFDAREVPGVVQEVDLELLREVGAINLNDALDLSASVARQNNFGGLWNSFAIRGFAGDENLPSGFLVNGFNAGRGFGGPRDLVGIERVEVLKGPKAALFGRGEPGGAVNLVTKRPDFATAGDIRLTVGSWEQLRFEGDVQTTLGSSEDFGVRLVGFTEDSESFRRTVETERLGFYPSVAWQISDETRLIYEMELTRQEIPFDRGVVALDGELGFMPIENFIGEPGDGPIQTDVLGHQLEAQQSFSDNWSLLAGFGYRETSLEGLAAEPNFGSRQTLSLDGRTVSRFTRSRNYDAEYYVLRAELAGQFNTGSLRHRLLVGVDHDQFDNDQVFLRFRPPGVPPGSTIGDIDRELYRVLDVLDPVYGLYPAPELSPNTDRLEVLEAKGFYLQDQIDVTDRVQVRLGGRYDEFSQERTNRLADPVTITKQSDTRFSPQVGAVYLPNEGFSIYASYGEGYRQLTGADFEGNQFEPNETKSSEVGVKFDIGYFLDGVSGMATVAAFQIDQSNILVFDDRPEASGGFFLRPAGEAESTGVEIDVDVQLPGDFGLWFSYAYIDAEYTNDSSDPNFVAPINAGDPLINVPENQLNIQASKAFQFGEKYAQLGGGLLYVGERLGQIGTSFYLPSYTTVRVFGQVELFEGLTLRVDFDNLFDEEFYTNSYADVWVEPGAPQRFRFTAAYNF